jgi:hypothetical protein
LIFEGYGKLTSEGISINEREIGWIGVNFKEIYWYYQHLANAL